MDVEIIQGFLEENPEARSRVRSSPLYQIYNGYLNIVKNLTNYLPDN